MTVATTEKMELEVEGSANKQPYINAEKTTHHPTTHPYPIRSPSVFFVRCSFQTGHKYAIFRAYLVKYGWVGVVIFASIVVVVVVVAVVVVVVVKDFQGGRDIISYLYWGQHGIKMGSKWDQNGVKNG